VHGNKFFKIYNDGLVPAIIQGRPDIQSTDAWVYESGSLTMTRIWEGDVLQQNKKRLWTKGKKVVIF
jgi:hypothetical protein